MLLELLRKSRIDLVVLAGYLKRIPPKVISEYAELLLKLYGISEVQSDRYAVGFHEHEWRTHGTCSSLSPDIFFTLARTAFHSVAIPPALSHLDHQISMPPSQIIDLFTAANPSIPRSSLAVSCGNNYLTAIEVCLNRSAQPTRCGPIRSCRANMVRIPPP